MDIGSMTQEQPLTGPTNKATGCLRRFPSTSLRSNHLSRSPTNIRSVAARQCPLIAHNGNGSRHGRLTKSLEKQADRTCTVEQIPFSLNKERRVVAGAIKSGRRPPAGKVAKRGTKSSSAPSDTVTTGRPDLPGDQMRLDRRERRPNIRAHRPGPRRAGQKANRHRVGHGADRVRARRCCARGRLC